MNRQAWLLRPFPDGETKHLDEFRRDKFVAVGWAKTGDLTGKSREDIKKILSGNPYRYSGLVLGNAYATIDIFVNRMRKDDYLLIPDGEDIYFAVVDSNYMYEKEAISDGCAHQRKIRNFTVSHLRNELSMSLRSSLKVHRTTADLSKHYDEIKALADGGSYRTAIDNIEVSYPLRPGYDISFSVPKDISKSEARRLSMYFESLYFKD